MFRFRLQRVLIHRARLENEAKNEYLAAKTARIAGEEEIISIHVRRDRLGESKIDDLVGCIELQSRFLKADDDEKAARIALGVLNDEEQAAEGRWVIRKQELQMIEKLRDKAKDQWNLEESRREQAALDEWAVLRRIA